MDFLNENLGLPSIFLFLSIFMGLILTVLWVLLPFSIIGIKPMLKKIIQQQESIKYLLEQIRQERISEKDTDPGSFRIIK